MKKKTSDALERSVEELVEAVQVLASDVSAFANLSQKDDTQFGRRAYVRAAFALVEGNLNLMAQVILDADNRAEIQLSLKDLEVLRQERHTSDSNGVPVIRVKFVPVCDRVAPVLEIFSRLFGKTFCLDKSRQGWVDFREAVELRNRITHPKNAQSFVISDSELDGVERAREWFADSVEALLEEWTTD